MSPRSGRARSPPADRRGRDGAPSDGEHEEWRCTRECRSRRRSPRHVTLRRPVPTLRADAFWSKVSPVLAATARLCWRAERLAWLRTRRAAPVPPRSLCGRPGRSRSIPPPAESVPRRPRRIGSRAHPARLPYRHERARGGAVAVPRALVEQSPRARDPRRPARPTPRRGSTLAHGAPAAAVGRARSRAARRSRPRAPIPPSRARSSRALAPTARAADPRSAPAPLIGRARRRARQLPRARRGATRRPDTRAPPERARASRDRTERDDAARALPARPRRRRRARAPRRTRSARGARVGGRAASPTRARSRGRACWDLEASVASTASQAQGAAHTVVNGRLPARRDGRAAALMMRAPPQPRARDAVEARSWRHRDARVRRALPARARARLGVGGLSLSRHNGALTGPALPPVRSPGQLSEDTTSRGFQPAARARASTRSREERSASPPSALAQPPPSRRRRGSPTPIVVAYEFEGYSLSGAAAPSEAVSSKQVGDASASRPLAASQHQRRRTCSSRARRTSCRLAALSAARRRCTWRRTHRRRARPPPCRAAKRMSRAHRPSWGRGGDRSAVRRRFQELREDRRRSLPRRHRAWDGRRSGRLLEREGAPPALRRRARAAVVPGPRAQQHGREGRPRVLPWSSRLR